MTTTPSTGKPLGTAATIVKFFGKKDGQTSKDVLTEIKELPEDERLQLAAGINDGSLNY